MLLLDGNPGLRTLASVAIRSRRALSLIRANAEPLPCGGVLAPRVAAGAADAGAVPPLLRKLADRGVLVLLL